MEQTRGWQPWMSAVYYTVMMALALYFVASAVQGDQGIFRRVQIESETQQIQQQLDRVDADIAHLRVKTRRLSKDYLDLDLLDERARAVLGYARPDEVLIR